MDGPDQEGVGEGFTADLWRVEERRYQWKGCSMSYHSVLLHSMRSRKILPKKKKGGGQEL